MQPDRIHTTFQFGSGLTRVGRIMLLIYGGIYVLELLLEHWLNLPVVRSLVLHPPGHPEFRVWQVLTHPFLHDPGSPLGFLITCLVFYFFSAPVERALGPRGFLVLFYASALGGLLVGLPVNALAGFTSPFMGMAPSLLSLIVVFGLLNPEATILLMFVLPVKAKYLSYGTMIVTLLTFLAKVNPAGAFHLGGILVGYALVRGPGNLFHPGLLYNRYLLWQARRRRGKFTVIQGRKDRDEDPGGPTYH
jgi:membrane associated rhomboid family serine protease